MNKEKYKNLKMFNSFISSDKNSSSSSELSFDEEEKESTDDEESQVTVTEFFEDSLKNISVDQMTLELLAIWDQKNESFMPVEIY